MERLRQGFGGVRSVLLQPPVHQRDLRPRQIVRQHIEPNSGVGFGRGEKQASFDFLRVQSSQYVAGTVRLFVPALR